MLQRPNSHFKGSAICSTAQPEPLSRPCSAALQQSDACIKCVVQRPRGKRVAMLTTGRRGAADVRRMSSRADAAGVWDS